MQINNTYKLIHKGKECYINAIHLPIAKKIDTNEDYFLQDNEIKAHMLHKHYIKDPVKFKCDVPQIMNDYKTFLKGEPLPQASAYHTYESAVNELKSLENQYPGLAKLFVIGKSAEGRDLVALKITTNAQDNTSNKPGVVITGLTHAREWATMETTLRLANDLVKGYENNKDIKTRIENLEIWVVPFVNPDGYVFSRNVNAWWRKNRRPITDTGCKTELTKTPIGVDLNRNYYDGNPAHFKDYRPDGDKPCHYNDDFGVTSDDPEDDAYRGPNGASEPETKALVDFELKTKLNIIAIADIHSFGEMLLYPWGSKQEEVPNIDTYKNIGNKVNKAMGNKYRLMQSIDLYPTSGTSEDMHQENGKISFTFEIGRTFHPEEEELPKITELVTKGLMAFLDYFVNPS